MCCGGMRLRIANGPKVLARADKVALGAMLPDVSSAPTLLPFASAWKLEEGKELGLADLGAEHGARRHQRSQFSVSYLLSVFQRWGTPRLEGSALRERGPNDRALCCSQRRHTQLL